MAKRIEIWEVEVKSLKNVEDKTIYHVSATNAATAERKALALAKRDNITRPYVSIAMYDYYIDA